MMGLKINEEKGEATDKKGYRRNREGQWIESIRVTYDANTGRQVPRKTETCPDENGPLRHKRQNKTQFWVETC